MNNNVENEIQDNFEEISFSPLLENGEVMSDEIVNETTLDVSSVLERVTRMKPYTLEEFQAYGKDDMLKYVERLREKGEVILGVENLSTGRGIMAIPIPTKLLGDVRFFTYLKWYRDAVGLDAKMKKTAVIDHFLQHICNVQRVKKMDVKNPYTFEDFEKYGKNDMLQFVAKLQQDGIQISGIEGINSNMLHLSIPTLGRGEVRLKSYLRWYKKVQVILETDNPADVLDNFLSQICGVERVKKYICKDPYTLEEFQQNGKEDMKMYVEKLQKLGVNISGLDDLHTGPEIFQTLVPTTIRGDVKFLTYLKWYEKVVGLTSTHAKTTDVIDHFLCQICGIEKLRQYSLEEFQKYGKEDMEKFVERLKLDGVKINGIEDLSLSLEKKVVPTATRGEVRFFTYMNWYKNCIGLPNTMKGAEILDHLLLKICGVLRVKKYVRLVPYSLEEFQKYGKEDMLRFVAKLQKQGMNISGLDGLHTGREIFQSLVPTTIRGDVKFITYLSWYKCSAGFEKNSRNGDVLDDLLLKLLGITRVKKIHIKDPYTMEDFQKYGKMDMEMFAVKLQQEGMKNSGVEGNITSMREKFVPTSIRGNVQFVTYLNWYRKVVGLDGYTLKQVLTHMRLTLLSPATQSDRRELVEQMDTGDEEYL